MLLLLHIKNIAIIEEANIEFGSGFNVLTGETGAGKSIIIDSISAIMGNRTTRDIIRKSAQKASVSGVFSNISKELKQLLQELGLDGDDEELTISREISIDGKNICRVNMKPVNVGVLKQLSPYLIDILGQHDGINLMEDNNHIVHLDNYSNDFITIDNYKKIYLQLKQKRNKLKNIEQLSEQNHEKIETLKQQISEIEASEIKLGEEEILVEKKLIMDNSAALLDALENSQTFVYGNDDLDGAYQLFCNTAREIESVANISDEIKKMLEKANEIKYLTSDLADEIIRIKSGIDFSSSSRDYVEERLDIIYKIKRKYADSIGGILAFYENAKIKLENISYDDIEKEQKEYTQILENCKKSADEISKNRQIAAKDISEKITTELQELDMATASFAVDIEKLNLLSKNGYDKVSFLIKTNAGDDFKRLSKIASGGELSRIMLAIKNIISQKELMGTMIFDEIDTGVSGRAGNKIAEKLANVSKNKQVICVTHLAAISAMADTHFKILKIEKSDKTYTNIQLLSDIERIDEVSRIISGDNITQISRENAMELISIAKEYKGE